MNLIIPSKSLLLSAALAAILIFVSLSLPFSADLLVGYATVALLVVLAGFEYRKPRKFRASK